MPSSEATKLENVEVPQNTHTTEIAPDVAEEQHTDIGDDRVPIKAFHDLPVVGLGGSAGSLAPLQSFFSRMPADSGMAFVVILHLSPEHESNLADILQRSTPMAVTQVTDRVKAKPNHVYVIPPGKHLTMVDGYLTLGNLDRERGKHVAVDLFLRTLAETHGPNSTGVILSGGDADGSIGIKRIKERGGLTIAQDLQECEQAGMPRSAIETGMVDWVLRSAEMPARIVEFRRTGRKIRLADLAATVDPPRSNEDATVRDILAVLRVRTGRDFGAYKRGTIVRRIARRMQVNGVDNLADYHALLRTNPGESGALLQDLLISVTNFFRDRDAFHSLQSVIPELFKGKQSRDTVRVWVTACATGEEAYSIAILLAEYAAALEAPPRIQVFATDIDETAVAAARAAQYPETIVADVSEERLQRFFVRQQNHYRVNQAVREMVLFAIHDILRDAPFSQLDLVSCRNLLIYLNRDSQRRCFDLFHFALRPHGYLFLGISETAEDATEFFAPVDKKFRFYRRLLAARTGLPILAGPLSLSLALQAQAATEGKAIMPLAGSPPKLDEAAASSPPEGMSAGDFHFKLIEEFAPPSLVVNRQGQVIHASPGAARFLQIRGGVPTRDLLQLVHPMLRIELRAALFRATETNGIVNVPAVPVELREGDRQLIDLSVRPAASLGEGHFLVVFNERQSTEAILGSHRRATEPEGVVRSLERELQLLQQQLRNSLEQHGASTEEMKASNEELQAMNEELRSAAEELETSREELQSINEELTTVNLELKSKVDELSRANSDLNNLMSATNIPTVFVDRELRIQRYTPSAITVFHLIPTDLGRPLGDLRHRLEFDTLVNDAERVMGTLVPIERETRAANGPWFLARITPYRDSEDRPCGVVLTFVDISGRKEAERSLLNARDELEGRVDARTAELNWANQTLRAEIVEREHAQGARAELLRALVAAQESERGRISRDLHDSVGQQVTGLLLQLKALENDVQANPGAAGATISLIKSTAQAIAREIHDASAALRPRALDDLGLVRALRTFLDDWSERNGIVVQFDDGGMAAERFDPHLEITIYRLVCEALHNILKHAEARNISVVLALSNGFLSAIIEDDGVGFDLSELTTPDKRKRLGLAGIRERLALLNGSLTLDSEPGRGTTLVARVPDGFRHEPSQKAMQD